MTIAQVAKKYGLTADTLRYYEKIGLLTNVPGLQKESEIMMMQSVNELNL